MATDELRANRTEPLRCPNDGARLVEIERSEVLIDACPECRGIWLDRGELDKILAKERATTAATVPRPKATTAPTTSATPSKPVSDSLPPAAAKLSLCRQSWRSASECLSSSSCCC